MNAGHRIDITYFTDPLCCWSWAFEPQWRKLRFQFRKEISWRYCMGGLIPSWNHYSDSVNSVGRPLQMGSLWFQAEKISGMQMAHRIWKEDAPSSSFPSCIAVKAAALQSQMAGELYLRMIREACMLREENISKPNILVAVGEEIASLCKDFDFKLFQKDFKGERAKESFRNDWNEIRTRDIHRFPSLLVKGEGAPILLSGYRSYESLTESLFQVAPHLKKVLIEDTLQEYKNYWGVLTPREEEEFMAGKAEIEQLG
jgi:putative protein-disulfide isomerase